MQFLSTSAARASRSARHRRWRPALAVLALFAGGTAAAATPEYESPADESPQASLQPAQVSSDFFRIDNPVHSDGLMHHYVINSRFGVFTAYGGGALTIRLREVDALARIAQMSDVDVALASVTRGMEEDAKTVLDVAKNPLRTVTAIPKGVGHLFGGYRARAQELSGEFQQQTAHAGSTAAFAAPSAADTAAQAQRYVERYLGVTTAQMRWYKKLGVDPYTNNKALRNAVRHLAEIDAAASLGMHFVPVGIPYVGEVQHALDVIYNEDPAVLRARRRSTLASYGLTAAEVRHFENAILLSPTRQTLLLDAAKTLDGVAARDELFRHAMAVTSEEEIEVFLQSLRLLLQFHAREPLARIVPGLRLPAAQTADGRVFVFGAFDAVYWTADVATYERSTAQVLPPQATARELWFSGAVSARAQQQLETRGWRIHEQRAVPQDR